MLPRLSACRLRAILVRVSPRTTCTVAGFAPPADSGSGAAGDTDGAAACAWVVPASAGAGSVLVPWPRRLRGDGVGVDDAVEGGSDVVDTAVDGAAGASEEAAAAGACAGGVGGAFAVAGGGWAALVGAVIGAAAFWFSPGVYTAGSSSTVYSRIRRPRDQFTSTRKVTNGSGMASVECT